MGIWCGYACETNNNINLTSNLTCKLLFGSDNGSSAKVYQVWFEK